MRHFRWFRGLLLATVGMTLVSCSHGEETVSHRAFEVVDSGGVRIVYSGVWGTDAPRLGMSSSPVLVLSTPERPLVGVADAAFLSDGSVVATNAGVELVLFSPDGRVDRQLGRSGQGPGEFDQLLSVAVVGDTIITSEVPNTISYFDEAEGYLAELRLPTIPRPGSTIGVTRSHIFVHDRVDPNSALRAQGPPEILYATAHLLRIAPQTLVFDTLVTIQSTGWARLGRGEYLSPLYLPRSSWAVNEDGVVLGWTGEPQLWEFDAEGHLVARIDLDRPRRAFMAESRADWCPSGCQSGGNGRPTIEWPLPDHLPYFMGLLLSSNGDLWIREVPRGLDDQDQVWTILDRSRQTVGHVIVPQAFRLLDIHGERILVVRRDVLDVEHLEIYTIGGR